MKSGSPIHKFPKKFNIFLATRHEKKKKNSGCGGVYAMKNLLV